MTPLFANTPAHQVVYTASRTQLTGGLVPINSPIRLITDKMISELGEENALGMSVITKKMLASVKTSDVDEAGKQLNTLIATAKGFDPAKMKPGMFGMLTHLFTNTKERMLAEYASVESRIDELLTVMNKTQTVQIQRVADMELLYEDNVKYYVGLCADEQRGQAMLISLKDQVDSASTASDSFAAQQHRDLTDRYNRLEKRIDDFKRTKILAELTAPQIRGMQDNARTLATKFADIKITTLPAYRSAFTLYILQSEQKKAAELADSITDATDQVIRAQAALLRQNTVQIEHTKQRSVISIETLTYVQQQLIGAADDAKAIADTAHQARVDAVPVLAQLQNELIQRFAITHN